MKISVIEFLVLILITLFIYTNEGFCQLPQFFREKIEITINGDFCQIEGDYYFRNNQSFPLTRSLFYPFPLDSTMFYPDSIKVNDVQNKNISFLLAKTGIYFPIEIPPRKTVLYKVHYSQKTTNNKIEYILTTTQNWGKPLKKAEFIIKLLSKFNLIFLSYEYDEPEQVNNYFIYKIHKENFMPKKNLQVEWARRMK